VIDTEIEDERPPRPVTAVKVQCPNEVEHESRFLTKAAILFVC